MGARHHYQQPQREWRERIFIIQRPTIQVRTFRLCGLCRVCGVDSSRPSLPIPPASLARVSLTGVGSFQTAPQASLTSPQISELRSH